MRSGLTRAAIVEIAKRHAAEKEVAARTLKRERAADYHRHLGVDPQQVARWRRKGVL